jgi:hypothetical protein
LKRNVVRDPAVAFPFWRQGYKKINYLVDLVTDEKNFEKPPPPYLQPT